MCLSIFIGIIVTGKETAHPSSYLTDINLFPNFSINIGIRSAKFLRSITTSAFFFTISTGQKPTVKEDKLKSFKSFAPSTTTITSSLVKPLSSIKDFTESDLSEVTDISTSSSLLLLKTKFVRKYFI